jgi:hypothetical protein
MLIFWACSDVFVDIFDVVAVVVELIKFSGIIHHSIIWQVLSFLNDFIMNI